eukprot:jgi/Ulvmu1/11628/UM008_0032.1
MGTAHIDAARGKEVQIGTADAGSALRERLRRRRCGELGPVACCGGSAAAASTTACTAQAHVVATPQVMHARLPAGGTLPPRVLLGLTRALSTPAAQTEFHAAVGPAAGALLSQTVAAASPAAPAVASRACGMHAGRLDGAAVRAPQLPSMLMHDPLLGGYGSVCAACPHGCGAQHSTAHAIPEHEAPACPVPQPEGSSVCAVAAHTAAGSGAAEALPQLPRCGQPPTIAPARPPPIHAPCGDTAVVSATQPEPEQGSAGLLRERGC